MAALPDVDRAALHVAKSGPACSRDVGVTVLAASHTRIWTQQHTARQDVLRPVAPAGDAACLGEALGALPKPERTARK